MKKGNRSAYDKLIPLLNIKKDDRILEIGYGHGIGIDTICQNYDCTITGIDFSELMFNESTARNQRHIENKKVELDFGDYLDFDYSQASFDKIFFINVIYFWDNLKKPFNKINKELKHDGKLCIFMANRDDLKRLKFTKDDIFNKYTIDFVCEELEKSGFQNINYKFDNGYFISCEKQTK